MEWTESILFILSTENVPGGLQNPGRPPSSGMNAGGWVPGVMLTRDRGSLPPCQVPMAQRFHGRLQRQRRPLGLHGASRLCDAHTCMKSPSAALPRACPQCQCVADLKQQGWGAVLLACGQSLQKMTLQGFV